MEHSSLDLLHAMHEIGILDSLVTSVDPAMQYESLSLLGGYEEVSKELVWFVKALLTHASLSKVVFFFVSKELISLNFHYQTQEHLTSSHLTYLRLVLCSYALPPLEHGFL